LVIIGLVAYLLFRVLGKTASSKTQSVSPSAAITLTYYGLWEPSSVMKPVIDAFEKQNPNIKVDYQLQSPQDYQDRVKTALGGQSPPDVVRLHSTWLPLFAADLLPAPPNTLSATELATNFYPIISKLLVSGSQVYGAPMTAETLGLFVNTAILQQKQLQPPKTWEDLLTAAKAVRELEPITGKIRRAGVALGNTSNVELNIVSMMLLKPVLLLQTSTVPGGYYFEVLHSFVTKHQVWDTLPPSTVAP
jgi:ABC-type glycerol-3-phosphate transport system substrate-binding protein